MVKGTTLCRAGLKSWNHLAAPLGDFLNTLHHLEGARAPTDEWRRTDLAHIRGHIAARTGEHGALVAALLAARAGEDRATVS